MGIKCLCDYCHGITYDDDRGNCIACGAPRSIVNVGAMPQVPEYLRAFQATSLIRVMDLSYASSEAPIEWRNT